MVAALRSKRIKYGTRLLNLHEFLTSRNTNITFLWLVRQSSLVVISTNVLVSFTVRARRLLLPWKKEEQNPRNIGTYAPDYKRPFSFMHFIVLHSGSWSCLSFRKGTLSLCGAHCPYAGHTVSMRGTLSLCEAHCPYAKHEGMRERRGIVPLNLNLHTKRVSGQALSTSRFTSTLSALGTHYVWGEWGPTASLDGLEKTGFLPLSEIEPRFLGSKVRSLVTTPEELLCFNLHGARTARFLVTFTSILFPN
jgi:hypothetical protein